MKEIKSKSLMKKLSEKNIDPVKPKSWIAWYLFYNCAFFFNEKEKRGFGLTYDKDSKFLYLLAPSEELRNLWRNILEVKIQKHKLQLFEIADKEKLVS